MMKDGKWKAAGPNRDFSGAPGNLQGTPTTFTEAEVTSRRAAGGTGTGRCGSYNTTGQLQCSWHRFLLSLVCIRDRALTP